MHFLCTAHKSNKEYEYEFYPIFKDSETSKDPYSRFLQHSFMYQGMPYSNDKDWLMNPAAQEKFVVTDQHYPNENFSQKSPEKM